MVADHGHTDNSILAKVSPASVETANLGFQALEHKRQCWSVAPLKKGASAMRCSCVRLGGRLRSSRGADAPLLLAPAMSAESASDSR